MEETKNLILQFFFQANCLYDFEGDADNGELTFRAGDILTIIRQVFCYLIFFFYPVIG